MAKRFEKFQIDALNLAFEESDHLTKEKKIELMRATGLDMEQITSWFNRRRSQKRARESRGDLERTNAELQQALQESKEREARLQQELEESRRREVELGAVIHHLRQQLGVVEADSGIDPDLRFVNEHTRT